MYCTKCAKSDFFCDFAKSSLNSIHLKDSATLLPDDSSDNESDSDSCIANNTKTASNCLLGEISAPFPVRVHRFAWHVEYVTPHSNETLRTNKFYRSRLGLHRSIDIVDIDIDEEMWYSMTPSGISKSHARRFGSKPCILLDSFTGIGGDLLHLHSNVFAIGCEINQERILVAKSLHSQLSSSRADFVLSDSHNGVRPRRISPVFGNRKLALLELDGSLVFHRARQLVKNDRIAFYLPRGMDLWELAELARETGSPNDLTVDVHASYDPDDQVVKDKYKVRALTAYFGFSREILS